VPELLSQTGCFDQDDPSRPGPELLAFEPNAPLWTDGADKQRWFSVPAGSVIEVDDTGDFIMPVGSVMAKTFIMDGRLLETRLFMHHPEGWRGYPYRWNDSQTDARLVLDGDHIPDVGSDSAGWTIPSSAQCGSCHNEGTNVTLGLDFAQLNGDIVDPLTGDRVNQLEALETLGVLKPLGFPRDVLPRLADYRDESQPLDERASAYLHANCASCHTDKDNFCSGDLRWFVSEAEQGLCNEQPKQGLAGFMDDTRLIAPGDPDRSALVYRMSAEGDAGEAMPPIGRGAVDHDGVALIRAWIEAMEGCEQ